MSEPVNIATRRAIATDAAEIVRQIEQGAETLHTLVSGWPLSVVRSPDIIGAERSLVGLQVLLAQLRNHTKPHTAA
ncbi:MAG: hypothetical protein ABIQ70_07010 [Dokdonella sp.]